MEGSFDIRACTNRERRFDGPAAAAVSLCGSKTNVAKMEERRSGKWKEKVNADL